MVVGGRKFSACVRECVHVCVLEGCLWMKQTSYVNDYGLCPRALACIPGSGSASRMRESSRF